MPSNVSKCKVIHIDNKNVKFQYSLMDQKIPLTSEEKDLGVFFSDTFKLSLNCSKASKSTSKIVGMMRKNVSNRSSECTLILCKTLVRPILDYCIPVWTPNTKNTWMLIR